MPLPRTESTTEGALFIGDGRGSNPVSNGDVVLRVSRNRNFKTISLLAVHDDRLSWKAKGLHTYLVSRPDGWKFNRTDLERRSLDGRDSVLTGLKELRGAGYLETEEDRAGDGTFTGLFWVVYEQPVSPHTENPDTDNPYP